jgi:D-glucosaminate-6-phosphate ammonia-lyase
MPDLPTTSTEDLIDADAAALYARLGARPVINAAGAYTVLGGSQLSPGVRKAMDEANRYFADMKTLLGTSGEIIAGLLDAEAALVTSGAAAALTLAAAAVLTKDHPERFEVLPHTDDFPHEILTQRLSRQKYDRCVEFSGAKLVEYGDANGTTIDQLEAAITAETVALHYFVPPDTQPGLLPLETVIEVGHAHGLPVIVDAAGHTYPVDEMRRYTRAGADLVAYANKYFDGPHSTGTLAGRKDLIDLALTNSFIGFETSGYLTIGRPMKVDRQEIFATVVALQEWLAMDHEDRFLRYSERCDLVLRELAGIEGIDAYRISERETPLPVVREGVKINLSSAAAAETAVMRLREGDPCIWLRSEGPTLILSAGFCGDEEFELVARRLREVLS